MRPKWRSFSSLCVPYTCSIVLQKRRMHSKKLGSRELLWTSILPGFFFFFIIHIYFFFTLIIDTFFLDYISNHWVLHFVFQNLVFVVLVAGNKLIALVRMKKYHISPSDLHLVFNMVNASESFKTAESWTPICLPNFDSR